MNFFTCSCIVLGIITVGVICVISTAKPTPQESFNDATQYCYSLSSHQQECMNNVLYYYKHKEK